MGSNTDDVGELTEWRWFRGQGGFTGSLLALVSLRRKGFHTFLAFHTRPSRGPKAALTSSRVP